MDRDLIVVPHEGGTRVRGRFSNEEAGDFADASEAIQVALDKAAPGGSVQLASGEYALKRPVELRSRVVLSGMGEGTVLVAASDFEGEALLMGTGLDGAVVRDLAMAARSDSGVDCSGVVLDGCGDCKVLDVLFASLGAYGVHLRDRSFLCEVRGCRFAGCGKAGLFLEYMWHGGRGGDYVPTLVTNCIAYGGNVGFLLKRGIVINMVGCAAYQSKSHGFLLTDSSNSVVLSGCRTFQIQDDAVVVDDSDEINITGNTFCWHDGNGIVLRNVNWGTLSGNNVIDTGHVNIVDDAARENWTYWVDLPEDFDIAPHMRSGIVLEGECRGLTVNGNAVFNWGSNTPLRHGIVESAKSASNHFAANNVNFCREEGVLARGEGSRRADNTVDAALPHVGRDSLRPGTDPAQLQRMHRYDVRRIENFIKERIG